MLRFCVLIIGLLLPVFVMAQSNDSLSLSQAQASSLAKLPLKCVRKEYPNKLDHVMNDGGEVLSPDRKSVV